MAIYDVRVKVPTRLLTPLLELIEGEGLVVSMGKEPEEKPKKKSFHFRNGVRFKGIEGQELLIRVLEEKPLLIEEIRPFFLAKGFAEKTTPSTVSRAMSQGLVYRRDDGRIALTPKGLKLMTELNANTSKDPRVP